MAKLWQQFRLVWLISALAVSVSASTINLFPNDTWTSGYITLEREGDQLFYLLFKSRNLTSDSLLIWLNGGPGCASTLGLFEENGPWRIDRRTLTFRYNEFSWNQVADVLYVDQPLNVGYSRAADNSSLCRDEACIAQGFHTFLKKFMRIHQEYEGKPVYFTGESYAGKFIPAIVAHVCRSGDIPIKGIAIGNPFIEQAVHVSTYPEYLYENSVVGLRDYYQIKTASILCRLAISLDSPYKGQLCELDGLDLVNVPNPSNIHDNDTYFRMHAVVKRRLSEPEVQRSFGVNTTFALCNFQIPVLMSDDKSRSQRGDLEYVLDRGVKVLLYYGGDDAVCDWEGGEKLSLGLSWSGEVGFRQASVVDWLVEGKVAGKRRTFMNFEFLKVLDAGHMVPFDQPHVALEMIKEFISEP